MRSGSVACTMLEQTIYVVTIIGRILPFLLIPTGALLDLLLLNIWVIHGVSGWVSLKVFFDYELGAKLEGRQILILNQ
jgi:hypothetical protein